MAKIVRVLVVDDSPLVRQILCKGLAADSAIEVVGQAGDPYEARDLIVKLRPDVLTLDVEMPRMNGVEFLQKLMPQHPLPVVMVSSLTERGKKTTLEAMAAGAVDFVTKPQANIADALTAMMDELRTKVKIAATANVSHWKHQAFTASSPVGTKIPGAARPSNKVIAIGSSTGGTEALRVVLSTFRRDMPGAVCVQHMPVGFTKMFADRLNNISPIAVKEAEDRDLVLDGRALIAPGGRQLEVQRSPNGYCIRISDAAECCGHRPSVEFMMNSVAKSVGKNAVGVMLTGMGADGAGGMKAMRDAGARCIAQDEESCVVFGMPKEAFARGGAEKLVPLSQIAGTVQNLLR